MLEFGLHYDISAEEYFAIDAVNNSSLNDFERSPAHYFSKHLKEGREPRKETPSMYLGTAIHTAVLEFEKFCKLYCIKPLPENFPTALDSADDYKKRAKELSLKTSATKTELKKAILELAPQTIFFDDVEEEFLSKYKVLKPAELETCMAISHRIKGSPTASTLFDGGKSEVTILWQDPETGLACKARIDYLNTIGEMDLLIDFKSTEDARAREFSKSIAQYNYHRQSAHYRNGLKALGRKPDLFIFAAYEKVDPFAAGFYYASDSMIETGEKELSALMRKLAVCKKTNTWPAYNESLAPIDLPLWKLNLTEDIICQTN